MKWQGMLARKAVGDHRRPVDPGMAEALSWREDFTIARISVMGANRPKPEPEEGVQMMNSAMRDDSLIADVNVDKAEARLWPGWLRISVAVGSAAFLWSLIALAVT